MSEERSYTLTDHAREQAERRGIALSILDDVMNQPGQIVGGDSGRKIYQSRVEIEGKLYIVRVIVKESDPLTVVTVYRTSNIKKYWSDES